MLSSMAKKTTANVETGEAKFVSAPKVSYHFAGTPERGAIAIEARSLAEAKALYLKAAKAGPKTK